MTPLPNKLNSVDPFAVAFNRLLQCIEERTPLDSDTVKVWRGQVGFTMVSAPAGTHGEAPTFRGEWLASNSYEAGDEVKISNGIEAGTYVAMTVIPAAPSPIPTDWEYYPWSGDSWVLKGRVNDQSSWV